MFTSTSAFELDENATLNCKTKFRCQSVWVNLVRYIKKIGVNLGLQDNKVVVLKNGTVGKPAPMLQKALYNHCINNLLKKANDFPFKEVSLRYRALIETVQILIQLEYQ